MVEGIPVSFAYSFLEYKAILAEPLFGQLIGHDAAVIKGLYSSLKEWGLPLENIIIRQQPANAAEIRIDFNLPRIAMTVQLGLSGVTIFVTNPDWSQAGRIVQVSSTATAAVRQASKTDYASHQISLAMHIIPKGAQRKDIAGRFVRIDQSAMAILGDIKALGFSVTGKDASWVVDASALYDDALFVRIVRNFGGQATLPEMATLLKKDEEQILQLLGLHEDA